MHSQRPSRAFLAFVLAVLPASAGGPGGRSRDRAAGRSATRSRSSRPSCRSRGSSFLGAVHDRGERPAHNGAALTRGSLTYPHDGFNIRRPGYREVVPHRAGRRPGGIPAEIYDPSGAGLGWSRGHRGTRGHGARVVASRLSRRRDTHFSTHLYYYESGSNSRCRELLDLRAVIDDINIMNPAFVLFTGDVVNEGELRTP